MQCNGILPLGITVFPVLAKSECFNTMLLYSDDGHDLPTFDPNYSERSFCSAPSRLESGGCLQVAIALVKKVPERDSDVSADEHARFGRIEFEYRDVDMIT